MNVNMEVLCSRTQNNAMNNCVSLMGSQMIQKTILKQEYILLNPHCFTSHKSIGLICLVTENI